MAEAPRNLFVDAKMADNHVHSRTGYVMATSEPGKGRDVSYTRTDLCEEAVRQRDRLLAAAKRATTLFQAPTAGARVEDGIHAELRTTIAACASPPLARGDVKTGKVMREG